MNRILFLSVLAAAVLSFGCAGADRAQEPAKKHRKIALHGYVYQDISLADTVKKAAERTAWCSPNGSLSAANIRRRESMKR